NPVAVIPIGLDTGGYGRCDNPIQVYQRWPSLRGRKIILFLGRVAPVKRVDVLLRAWGELAPYSGKWVLVIAGPDWQGYRAQMERLVDSCGISSCTLFTGNVIGRLKQELLGIADLYVLPSECENFGITVAEALASGCPVITTRGTLWKQIQDEGCGWWIERDLLALKTQLRAAMELSDPERVVMGQRGQTLVRTRYAWPPLAQEMLTVYRWLIGQATAPACVDMWGCPNAR
ncbi:MAG TPA: glycosyltransferase, partial [Phycisphaerae bacterium]|nr:glycosyltransferase [Phycisphaerae bacterium]